MQSFFKTLERLAHAWDCATSMSIADIMIMGVRRMNSLETMVNFSPRYW